MKAYIITIPCNQASADGAGTVIASHLKVGNEFPIETFAASTPADLGLFDEFGIRWTYPWDEDEEVEGLTLHPYRTRTKAARMACFLSHYRLWRMARVEPILILEDDALWIRKMDPEPLLDSKFQVIGINDPRRATRRAAHYHFMVQSQPEEVWEAPKIDKAPVPQGLAGASAYIIKPPAAAVALRLVDRLGAWPNDSTLCRQLLPGMLGVTRTYYTKVQGTPSTLAW